MDLKRENAADVRAPIFVVGAPRSGTTLVAKILGCHSRIFMPGETHFFDDIFSRRRSIGDPRDPEARAIVIDRLMTLYGRYNEPLDQKITTTLFSEPKVAQELKSCRDYESLFSSFMRIQARRTGKTRWGNHVPKDIFSMREILSFYPSAKVLICVRDVRDFLVSYQNKWKVASTDGHRLKSLYHPVVTSFLWKFSIRQIALIKSLARPENAMTVRYENLVENPRKVVCQICEFIEEEFEETMLDVRSHNSSFQTQGQGIFSSSVGRWCEELGSDEIYVAQKIAGTELQMLGYTPATVDVHVAKLLSFIATAPFALARSLWVNREMSGPMIPYLLKRCAALLCKTVPTNLSRT